MQNLVRVFSPIVFFLLVGSSLKAQVAGGKHQKLFDMYVLGDYEKCADRAMKMTENDKTKYDSEPYLYVAICYLKLHDDPEIAEFYPDAIKNALKYGGKFKKRDDRLKSKEQEYIFDQNLDHINTLKSVGIREARGFYSQEEYRKALVWYKLVYKVDPNDPISIFMKGVVDLYTKNTREGMEFVEKALANLQQQASEGSFIQNDYTVDSFEDAFTGYARYLNSKGDRRGAQNIVKLGRELDPKNKKLEQLQIEME